MARNNILIIILGIIFLGLAGFSFNNYSHTPVPKPSVTPQPTVAPGFVRLPQTNKNVLQLQTFTPAPTQAPVVNSTIDFSSPSLDWDDVGAIFYYIGYNPLSSKCTSELNAAVQTEDSESYPPHPYISFNPQPNSRVGLCSSDPSCKKNGYNAYNGTVPLPISVPSKACQIEIASAYQKALSEPHYNAANWNELINELHPPIFPNCDQTDEICY